MSPTISPKHFDHTLLRPSASQEDIGKLCAEAVQFGFASVCVNPFQVLRVKQLLADSEVKTCTVVGFPLGANTSAVKAFETERAICDGADEIDMVMNLSAFRDGSYQIVEQDIREVVAAAGSRIVKVILETCLLEQEEIVAACGIVEQAGAHFVKTSTGFADGGATVEDIRLMKKTVGDRLQIKASGGITTVADAKAMIEAGADRIGASAGAAIMMALAGSRD